MAEEKKATTSEVTKKEVKKKKPGVIIGVVVGILLIAGLISLAYFAGNKDDGDDIDKGEQKEVKTNVSDNYAVYDKAIEKAHNISDEVIPEEEEEAKTSEEVTANIAKFQANLEKVDSVIAENEEAKTKLENGPVSETEELASLMKESIDANTEMMNLSKDVLEFRVCVDGKTLKYLDLTDDMTALESRMSSTDMNQMVSALKDMEALLSDAIINTEEIKTCFSVNSELFGDENVEQGIDELKQLFVDLKSAMTLLREGVEETDMDKINEATELMGAIEGDSANMEDPEFIDAYQEALEEKISPLEEKVKKAEEKVDEKIKEIADEYSLDEDELTK